MKYLLSFLFLLSPILHFGQSHFPSGDQISFGLNHTFQTVKDASLSPVSYSGPMGGLQLGYDFQNERWLGELEISGTTAWQYPDVNREGSLSQTQSTLARVSYTLQYRWFKRGQWAIFSGLANYNFLDYRNHNRYSNSQDNYIATFALGPALSLQKPFSFLKKDFLFQSGIILPIGGYHMRPGYVKPYTNNDIGSESWAFWGEYFTIDWDTDIRWYLKNNNQLELGYRWAFSQLEDLNKVQLAEHEITLNLILTL